MKTVIISITCHVGDFKVTIVGRTGRDDQSGIKYELVDSSVNNHAKGSLQVGSATYSVIMDFIVKDAGFTKADGLVRDTIANAETYFKVVNTKPESHE